MEIYFDTDVGLDSLAATIARLINVGESNPSHYQSEQRRESQNRGGTYYLFEILGLELILLQNTADASIPERGDWPYYLLIDGKGLRKELADLLCQHLADLLQREGIRAEVDELAA